jgi:hypothetical protein
MGTRAPIIILSALTLAAVVAGDARASQYPGRGDTGWVYAGKRECCNEAIAMAQNESANACRNIGGTPSQMRGGVQRRGFCNWESNRDASGATLFRCYAEAAVWCR